jgi:hypothetical protein
MRDPMVRPISELLTLAEQARQRRALPLCFKG